MAGRWSRTVRRGGRERAEPWRCRSCDRGFEKVCWRSAWSQGARQRNRHAPQTLFARPERHEDGPLQMKRKARGRAAWLSFREDRAGEHAQLLFGLASGKSLQDLAGKLL